MTPEMLAAWLIPAITVGGLIWRLSSKLTEMDAKLDRLEDENQRLRADIMALQTLLAALVDRRANKP